MVSTVSLLLVGAFSIICFCRSMKLIPLFANSLLRLITESLLYFAIVRSACTSSYLQVIGISTQLRSERNGITGFKGQLHTLDEHQSVRLPSWYNCEQPWCLSGRPQTPHTSKVYDPTVEEGKEKKQQTCNYSIFIAHYSTASGSEGACLHSSWQKPICYRLHIIFVSHNCLHSTTEVNQINVAKKHTFQATLFQ